MAIKDRETLERLNAFWDALVRGAEAGPPELDPQLAATVRWLQALDDAPPPDPAFTERLRQQLPVQPASTPAVAGRRRTFRVGTAGRWRVLGGLAAVAAVALLVLRLSMAPGAVGLPGAAGTAAPSQPPIAATVAPGSTTLPQAPPVAHPPPPSWTATDELAASDQGITLGYFLGVFHEPRFIALFLATSGGADLGDVRIVPSDLKVLDQDGREYPLQVAVLESGGSASLLAVTVRGVDRPMVLLRLQASQMQVEDAATGQSHTVTGAWDLEPLWNQGVEHGIRANRLLHVGPLPCLRLGEVTIGRGCYPWCDGPPPTAPPAQPPPSAPAPPPPGANTLPPTEAPVATAEPWPTSTPAPVCGFTDWDNGVFGETFVVTVGQPRRVHVLIERETGQVRRVSAQEFEQAAGRAHQ